MKELKSCINLVFISMFITYIVTACPTAYAGEYELRVTAECVAKGGDEKVIAACITAKLTEKEIKKCLSLDPGECFGPNNEIRKAVSNAINDVTKGPGENNDLVGRKGWLRQRLGF